MSLVTQRNVALIIGWSRLQRLLHAGWLKPVERSSSRVLFSHATFIWPLNPPSALLVRSIWRPFRARRSGWSVPRVETGFNPELYRQIGKRRIPEKHRLMPRTNYRLAAYASAPLRYTSPQVKVLHCLTVKGQEARRKGVAARRGLRHRSAR